MGETKKLTKKLQDSGYKVRKFVRREPKSEDEIYWSPSRKEIDINKEPEPSNSYPQPLPNTQQMKRN